MESQRSWDVWQSQASTWPVSSFADVNVAFQQSAHKVLLDDDNLLPLLHLTIEYHGKEHKGLPCFHAPSLLLPVIVSSASIHFCRNHIILYLRNHLIHFPHPGRSTSGRSD